MAPWVAGLRRRGFQAVALTLPLAAAEKAIPGFLRLARPDVVLGGTSFGARVASLAAAEAEVAGLLCLAYPLADQAEQRTRHWPRVACPTLIVNGDRDELTDAAELRRLVPLLPRGRLELVPGAGHVLLPQLEQVLDLAASFLATLARG